MTVEVVEPMGAETNVWLTTGKSQLTAKMDTKEEVEVNQDIEVVINMNKIHIFDIDTRAKRLYKTL